MIRYCEVCGKDIPSDFANLLCLECYDKSTQINEARKKLQEEEDRKNGILPPEEKNAKEAAQHIPFTGKEYPINGFGSFVGGSQCSTTNFISDPNYKENPVQEEIDMLRRNFVQYIKTGYWIWKPTRSIYNFIRDSFIDIVKVHPQYGKFIWKPTVCDIGCGTGVGTNILSQEADFIWGIDKNPDNVKFATEMFTRQKNGIYYTPEIRFDVTDIENEPREMMKFDVLVAVELIEHLANPESLMVFIKRLCKPKNSIAWISTPNRQNRHLGQTQPRNKYHTREFNGVEFATLLRKHFGKVNLFNSIGEPVEETTNHTPLLALVQSPL